LESTKRRAAEHALEEWGKTNKGNQNLKGAGDAKISKV